MLSVKQVGSLPALLPQGQQSLAGKSPAELSEFYQTNRLDQTVEVRPAVEPRVLGSRIRLLAWNARSCRYIDESAKTLAGLKPDVLLLSEMDYGMARSGQHHTTADLAQKLNCGYAWGLEIAYSSDSQPNQFGWRGNAILSPAELVRPGLVRLSTFRSDRRSFGSRLAVLTTIKVGDQEIVFASTHLENWTGPQTRAGQLELLLQAIDDYAPGCPAVIAGDMNSLSFELTRDNYKDPETFRQLIKQDTGRFLDPTSHEPLFALAQRYGYNWRDCNIVRKSTQRCNFGPFSLRGNTRNLDWFFVRGLQPSNPRVVDATMADIDWALSDHEIICLDVELENDS